MMGVRLGLSLGLNVGLGAAHDNADRWGLCCACVGMGSGERA